MAAPTTYFQSAEEDKVFLDLINATFPAPSNQPYLFYFFAAKSFYQAVSSTPVELLIQQSDRIIDVYRTTFQSRYTPDQLLNMCEVTVAFLAGELNVVFALPANGISIMIEGRQLTAQQGPYTIIMQFDAEHKLIDLRF